MFRLCKKVKRSINLQKITNSEYFFMFYIPWNCPDFNFCRKTLQFNHFIAIYCLYFSLPKTFITFYGTFFVPNWTFWIYLETVLWAIIQFASSKCSCVRTFGDFQRLFSNNLRALACSVIFAIFQQINIYANT